MFTFPVRVRSNGNELEMRRDAHSKPVLELTQSVCNERMCDTIDKLMLVIHQLRNDYHPIRHDNETDEMCLEYPHENRGKNHIQLDELLPHQLLYQEEYCHFYRTEKQTFVGSSKSVNRLYLLLFIGTE